MENYYLKYAGELPYPYPPIKKLKEDYLIIWKQNIINELSILKNLFMNKYVLYLEEKIKDLINTIISIIEEYRYAFLDNYTFYLSNEDKIYINITDEENSFKLKFLKEIYNTIFILIDTLLSSNKFLSLIYQDKLKYLEQKSNSNLKNSIIKINNEEFLYKFNSDVEKLQNKLAQYKDIFNFKNNHNNIYPNDEELNKLFEEFNAKNQNKNIEIQNKIKKCNNKIIKDKLISKKVDITIRPNDSTFEELLNISKTIQEIKNDIKDIKEKQNNYCLSSLINKNIEFEEFNNIKNRTIKINHDVICLKDEIKMYNEKYWKMVNDIENQTKKYEIIKNKNDEVNNKINSIINKYK